MIINLRKKRNLSDCSNWRLITLANVARKILTRIMLESLKSEIDATLRKKTKPISGNRNHAIDQIYIMMTILEVANGMEKNVLVLYIDFEKVFDSVIRQKIWKILPLYRKRREVCQNTVSHEDKRS